MILPIRHQISIEELVKRVPLLAGKLVLNSSDGVAAIARKLVEVIRPEALRLDQSHADAQKANSRLLEQLDEAGKNPTLAYRVSSGHGVAPEKFDLESLEKIAAKDAIASIYHSGIRIDLLPKDPNEYRKNPVTFELSFQDAGAKKFLKAMETGRAQQLTASEFGKFKTSLEFLPSFDVPAATQKLVIKPVAGRSRAVRVTFGNGPAAVVYDLMTHRTVRAGTLEGGWPTLSRDLHSWFHNSRHSRANHTTRPFFRFLPQSLRVPHPSPSLRRVGVFGVDFAPSFAFHPAFWFPKAGSSDPKF